MPTKGTWQLVADDVVRHVTAGGGGYGPPADRDPAARRADRVAGKDGLVDEEDHGGQIS